MTAKERELAAGAHNTEMTVICSINTVQFTVTAKVFLPVIQVDVRRHGYMKYQCPTPATSTPRQSAHWAAEELIWHFHSHFSQPSHFYKQTGDPLPTYFTPQFSSWTKSEINLGTLLNKNNISVKHSLLPLVI